MTLKTDDLFLVNRGGNSFKTEYELIKQNILIGAGGATVSETPPSDPHEGDFWYNPGTDELFIWVTDEVTGVVTGVGVRGSGSGYNSSATNVATSGGDGNELTVDIQAGVGGTIVNPTVNQGGHGYKTGDIVFITGTGHGNASLSITSVNVVALGAWESIKGYWDRTGTTLSPSNAGDSVDIGSGNIKLNANGSGVFGTSAATRSQLNAAAGLFFGQNGSTAVYRVDKNGNVNIGGTISGTENGSAGNNPNITLKADGSATFAVGNYTINKNGKTDVTANTGGGTSAFNISNDNTSGSGLTVAVATSNSTQLIQTWSGNGTRRAVLTDSGQFYIGGSLTGSQSGYSPNITLNANGSASFLGNLGVGRSVSPSSRLASLSNATVPIGLAVYREDGSGTNGEGLLISQGTDVKARIRWDGSAEFAGTVTAANFVSSGGGGIGGGGASAWGTVTSSYVLTGSLNCTINRDGVATGGVYYVVFDTPMPDANYAIVASASQEAGAGLLCQANYRDVTANGFTIVLTAEQQLANVDSSFAVFASNVQLPFTVTQTQIDEVLTLNSRIAAIESNEIIDDATDSSLLQLLSSATTRLTSIEERLAALEGN